VRRGSRIVVIRHGDREARLMDDGGFWISFAGGETKTTVASLVDDRCDSFTVGNLAESVVILRGSSAPTMLGAKATDVGRRTPR
jgi:hypothetical protein